MRKSYERLTVEEANGLERRLADVLASTEGIREQIRRENVKRDQRIRLSRVLILLVMVIAVAAVFVGFSGRRDAHDAKAALVAYQTDTQRVRINACYQANDQQGRYRQAFIDTSEVLIAQITRPTPEIARFIVSYRKATKVKAQEDFPDRDCTVQGLADYLSGRGGYLKPGQKNPPRP